MNTAPKVESPAPAAAASPSGSRGASPVPGQPGAALAPPQVVEIRGLGESGGSSPVITSNAPAGSGNPPPAPLPATWETSATNNAVIMTISGPQLNPVYKAPAPATPSGRSGQPPGAGSGTSLSGAPLNPEFKKLAPKGPAPAKKRKQPAPKGHFFNYVTAMALILESFGFWKTALKSPMRCCVIKNTVPKTFDESNPMAVALYDEGDTALEKIVKKKKPKKKKKVKDTDNVKEFKQPGHVDMCAQGMLAAGTTEKLLASGVLTDKQKAMIQNEAGTSLASQENLQIKGNEARNILMHKLMRHRESCVLLLKNMVGSEDVDEFLEEEIQEECSKYGQVDDVVIYQEKEGETDGAVTTVKIFVKFSLPQEAEGAKNSLNNRYFNGNVIRADIYDQNLFDHNDLTG